MATAKKKTTTTTVKPGDEVKVDPIDTDIDLSLVEGVESNDDLEESDEKATNSNMIKKKDVYDHVSVSTGLRKRDVREAVDSMLEFMHMCLSDGKDMQMPPLGKVKSIERGSEENIKLIHKITLKKIDESEKKDD